METPSAWVLADAAAGHRRQAEALAGALGHPVARTVECRLPVPWAWWAPRGARRIGAALPRGLVEAARLAPPAIAIGCGRIAAAVTAWLRARHGAFAVQILDPRIDRERWDVVVCPRHDGAAGANVIETLGSIHALDPAALAIAARARPDLLALPRPLTALLVGGPTRAVPYGAAAIDALLATIGRSQAGGSLVVTASRRTPPGIIRGLRAGLERTGGTLWAGDADGPNPYPAVLGAADRIVVTADSVNMASEACASGRPVFLCAPDGVRGKLARFHASLVAGGHARWLTAAPETFEPVPLVELPAVAAEVRRRFLASRPARAERATLEAPGRP